MADAILDWDTFMDGDETVQTGPQTALRIRAIGTDKAGTITPKIDGNDVGPIRTEIGDIHPEATSEQGLLDLGDLYYYVPPETNLTFDGEGSDLVRLQGEWIDSPASRFESSGDETRFNEQGEWHWTFTQGSVQVSETIADGEQFTVHTLTPNTDERYEFMGVHEVSQTSDGAYSTAEDEVSYLFEFDGQQRPSQFNDDSIAGIDHTTMPRPPTDSTDQVGFVYGDNAPNVDGFTITGDQTFKVLGRNVSGGALGNGGDTSTFTYTAAVRFRENI